MRDCELECQHRQAGRQPPKQPPIYPHGLKENIPLTSRGLSALNEKGSHQSVLAYTALRSSVPLFLTLPIFSPNVR